MHSDETQKQKPCTSGGYTYSTYCLFTDITDVDYFPIDYHLMLIPNVINGLGVLHAHHTNKYGVIAALAPLEMRGFYLGMMFTAQSIYEQLG